WSSIVEHVGGPVWDDGWVTITDLDRPLLAKLPWSMSGGSALHVHTQIENSTTSTLDSRAKLGLSGIIGEESAYFTGASRSLEGRIEVIRGTVDGTNIRVWVVYRTTLMVSPYSWTWTPLAPASIPGTLRHLWALRTTLHARKRFSVSLKE